MFCSATPLTKGGFYVLQCHPLDKGGFYVLLCHPLTRRLLCFAVPPFYVKEGLIYFVQPPLYVKRDGTV